MQAAVASGMVPLTAVTKFGTSRAPLQVNHQGLFPSVTVSFNLAPDVSLGHAVTEIGACGIGAVVIQRDPKTGVLSAGADPRRPTYALAW